MLIKNIIKRKKKKKYTTKYKYTYLIIAYLNDREIMHLIIYYIIIII